MGRKSHASICQTCFNFDCSWHKKFVPVEGWRARPTEIVEIHGACKHIEPSFNVFACPLYAPRRAEISFEEFEEEEKYYAISNEYL